MLVALHNATRGADWKASNNWLTNAPLPEWKGVTTNGNGRVTALALSYNQLNGEIPPELGNLHNLKILDLGLNQLTGEIPPEFGNLSKLGYLFLDENQLTGCVPSRLPSPFMPQYLGELQVCP